MNSEQKGIHSVHHKRANHISNNNLQTALEISLDLLLAHFVDSNFPHSVSFHLRTVLVFFKNFRHSCPDNYVKVVQGTPHGIIGGI